MKVLLHACCGPCSLEPTRLFNDEGIDFDLDYCNPHIMPAEEYEHRRETLRTFVAIPHDVALIEEAYDPETWEREVGKLGENREERCRACYRLRLERTARRAAELGYDAIATTLTISPYQYTQVILEELAAAAQRNGVQALCRDFSEHYATATRRSKELGMYRQNYCGCRFSIAEAAKERAQAKRERARQKAFKHRALIWAAAEGAVNQASQL